MLKSDLLGAIEKRCSRRKYIDKPIEPAKVEALQKSIDAFLKDENVKMRLVLNNGEAFNGFRKSYGLLSGVQNYIALVANPHDVLAMEKLGYFGECLVLQATNMELGTCWVAGFDRKSCETILDENEQVVCAITIGYTREALSTKEKLIRWATHRKTKSIEQMYVSNTSPPEWFMRGMEAVQKAPSAVNRQPVIFTYENEKVFATVDDISADCYAFDLGIAKLHFELGAGVGELWVT
jgi:nitroreductase